jgi:hypothetical protein
MAQGEQTVAQATEITWLGLDCTKLKMIGEAVTGEDLVNRYFTSWNSVVVTEGTKYDFSRAFKKAVVHKNLAAISELNAKVNPSDVIAYESHSISEDDLVRHVASYELNGEGVGLVFILENFNKMEERGSMWVTFIDMQSGSILMAKHMEARPGGFGIRNYWVRTVYEVLQMSAKEYKKWIK